MEVIQGMTSFSTNTLQRDLTLPPPSTLLFGELEVHQGVVIMQDIFSYILVFKAQNSANMVSVTVEPPTQVQRGMALYPPLVVSCPNGQYTFFQAVLVDSHGRVVDPDLLQGTLSVSPYALETSTHSSRGPKDFAVFPDLVISRSGTYTIRVNAYQMDFQSMPPTTFHGATVATREIRVRSSAVAEGRPCEFSYILRQNYIVTQLIIIFI
ncbi:hypothetical protein E0Z10_g5202 [Xylaria hypoxylon]|uniref:Velvet domain-containing protein n=1 Tax=Xylaria hypoxylon TaxID=37992 RepID=A0A4Z0Z1U4_9PEZI|nr:hypothetical protein E0Z10_g5202 [Xylaria hypoxylon]